MSKSDPTIGSSVETGDRIVGAGFKDSNGNYVTVVLDSSGNVPISGSLTLDTTGLALETKQDTGNASLAIIAGDTTSLDSKITACNTGAVVVSSSALPTGAATAANQQTDALTDAQLRATAVPVSGTITATPSVTGGGTEATAQRVTLANDSTGVLSIDDNGASITVDGTVTANAGTGTFTVDGSGVTQPISASSLPLPTGASTEANQSTANTTLSAIQTAVEILDNVVSGSEAQVDVVSSALPTGAATASNQSTANTALSAIQTAVEILDNAISGSEMQVDVVGSLPAGTNAIGKLSANSGVDIGDVDVTSTVTPVPTTSGGCLVANFNTGDTYTALTNSAQVIKASAGQLYGYYIYNPNSSAVYVLLYNVAAASVTVGTTTPQMVFAIPATAGANLDLTHGIEFTNAGWSIAATTTGGGNTAPTTALEAMIFYK